VRAEEQTSYKRRRRADSYTEPIPRKVLAGVAGRLFAEKWAQLGLNQGDPWAAVDGPNAVCREVQEKSPLAASRSGGSGQLRAGLRVDKRWTGSRQGSFTAHRAVSRSTERRAFAIAAEALVRKAHAYEVLAASHAERAERAGSEPEHREAASAFTVAEIVLREVAAAIDGGEL
jgi:hypothetical protein